MNALLSLLVFVASILSEASHLASHVAAKIQSLSWALEEASRLILTAVAGHTSRTTNHATSKVTGQKRALPFAEDSSPAEHDVAAYITHLRAMIAGLEARFSEEGVRTAAVKARLEGEVRGFQDQILKLRQERDAADSDRQQEVTFLREQVQTLEQEKKRAKVAILLNISRIMKKFQEEVECRKGVERENEDLLLALKQLLRGMDGLRAEIGAKDKQVIALEGKMGVLEGLQHMQKMFMEGQLKAMDYKDRQIQMLQREVEGSHC